MKSTIKTEEVTIEQASTVASLVKALLVELEPDIESEINNIDMTKIAIDLFRLDFGHFGQTS